VDEVTTNGCDTPSDIQSELMSARKVFISWNAVSNSTSYTVQIRFKGHTNWLVTTEVIWNKIFIYGPSNRNYEYRVRTNCSDESSAYSEILEYSSIGTFSTLASSRNTAADISTIIIPDEVVETIQLTPNPVRDALTLQYTVIDDATITIYHTSGQLIRRTTISKDNYSHPINVSDLKAGLYLLTIQEVGKFPITKRFIKIN